MAAVPGFRWEGAQTRWFARTQPGSYHSTALMEFLKQRKRLVGGQKVILIWDHWPAHRRAVMQEFLQTQRDWLPVEWLPGSAPDLHPTEPVWNNSQGAERANFCPDQWAEAHEAFRRG